MTNPKGRFITYVSWFTGSIVLSLLLAFPLMWTWNYVMPYLFNLPSLSWGQAWCLHFVASMLIKTIAVHEKE